jgi:hypothetical protein
VENLGARVEKCSCPNSSGSCSRRRRNSTSSVPQNCLESNMDMRSSAKAVSTLTLTVRLCILVFRVSCNRVFVLLIDCSSDRVESNRIVSSQYADTYLFLLFPFYSIPAKITVPNTITTVHRGKERGPWSDGLPFDGRDIWQFTLVMNDNFQNGWVIQPGSFHNLGRDRQARCWPWTNDRKLPYGRTGVDRDFCYLPGGAIVLHRCLGPFGCDGKDHTHDLTLWELPRERVTNEYYIYTL